ncbi:TadE/TadG family type IV pilus assembly protein [Methylobacterium komagatae]|uniref:TadE/TadG family type IV pilus assembly protein n=1 Tax=Methylobacterium komagatae TaxID=374425 RepID=A0ABW2BGH8_9HYPH
MSGFKQTIALTTRRLQQRLAAAVGCSWKDRRGGIALLSGLMLPVIVLLVGGSVDYARLAARKSQLQDAVDTGVLTGGNALKLAGSNPQTVKALTDRTVQVTARPVDPSALVVSAEVFAENDGVSASAREAVKMYFGGLVGLKFVNVTANARANLMGKMRLCMLTTDPQAMGAISLQSDARVTATNCSLYTNSNSARALIGEANAMAQAETICSAGGFDGPRANFHPSPRTECPTIKDPLSNRMGPSVGTCQSIPPASDALSYLSSLGYKIQFLINNQINNTFNSSLPFLLSNSNSNRSSEKKNQYELTNKIAQSTTLDPGTYCGGLLITGNAVVTLRAGSYVFKDGPLLVDKHASLEGHDVSLHFTGDASGVLFNTDTTISLTAPTSGSMAGLLLSDDAQVATPVDPALYLNSWNASLSPLGNCPLTSPPVAPTPAPRGQTSPMRMYRIISNNTRQMLGTIHLPGGRLVLDGERPVADQSNYTVVVAQQVNLYKGPNLVLNANYDRSNVPVPAGVGPIAGQVRLSK